MFKKKKKSLSEYSSWELIGYRFKKNKLAMIGVIMFAAIVIVTIFGPVFIPYERVIEQNVREKLQSPNAKYIFGTDELGRDLFARIIYGGRISLLCGLAIIGIAFVIGAIIGGIAGFVGGKVDTFLMRIVDAFPIPNTVVKLFSAENTWRAAAREDKATPTFFIYCSGKENKRHNSTH